MDIVDDFEITMTCECGTEYPVTVGRFRSGENISCPNCGNNGRDGDESIAELNENLRSLIDLSLQRAAKAIKLK